MSEFTEPNWKEALSRVYELAHRDASYRNLCLSDPVAAIRQVSDIDLPADINLQFFDSREKYVYTFLLPPLRQPGEDQQTEADLLIRWNTFCTDITG